MKKKNTNANKERIKNGAEIMFQRFHDKQTYDERYIEFD